MNLNSTKIDWPEVFVTEPTQTPGSGNQERKVIGTQVAGQSGYMGGDPPAIRELLLRTVGKPVESDLVGRIERLESTMTDGANEWSWPDESNDSNANAVPAAYAEARAGCAFDT